MDDSRVGAVVSKNSLEAGLNKLVWYSDSGVVRIVLSYYGENNSIPQLEVETHSIDSLGGEAWSYCRADQTRNLYLQSFALQLLGLTPDSGYVGTIVTRNLPENFIP